MSLLRQPVGLLFVFCFGVAACSGKASSDGAGCGTQMGQAGIGNLGGASAAGANGSESSEGGHSGEAGTALNVQVGGAGGGQGGASAMGGGGGAVPAAGRAGDAAGAAGGAGAGMAFGGAGAENAGSGQAGSDAAGAPDGGDVITGTLDIVGDTSWRTIGTDMGVDPPAGWNSVDFDDSAWTAAVAPNPAACGSYTPIQSWDRPNQPMWDVANEYSAFFRKRLTLPQGARINYAKITTFADDDIAIWVNGALVFLEDNFGVVEGGIIVPHEVDLAPFLVPGPNVIAIHAQDTIGGCRWAIVSGSLEQVHPAP